MTRNIIIIMVSFGIVGWNLFIFKRRVIFSKTTRNIALVMLVLWVPTTLLPNIPILLSPLSPAIHGQVIDAETKQPITDCNIQAYWQTETFFIAGGHWEAYKSFHTKTNSQGEFAIPRYQKALSVYFIYPCIITRYSGVNIFTYDYGHRYNEISISLDNLVYDSSSYNKRIAKSVNKTVIVKIVPVKTQYLISIIFLI